MRQTSPGGCRARSERPPRRAPGSNSAGGPHRPGRCDRRARRPSRRTSRRAGRRSPHRRSSPSPGCPSRGRRAFQARRRGFVSGPPVAGARWRAHEPASAAIGGRRARPQLRPDRRRTGLRMGHWPADGRWPDQMSGRWTRRRLRPGHRRPASAMVAPRLRSAPLWCSQMLPLSPACALYTDYRADEGTDPRPEPERQSSGGTGTPPPTPVVPPAIGMAGGAPQAVGPYG